MSLVPSQEDEGSPGKMKVVPFHRLCLCFCSKEVNWAPCLGVEQQHKFLAPAYGLSVRDGGWCVAPWCGTQPLLPWFLCDAEPGEQQQRAPEHGAEPGTEQPVPSFRDRRPRTRAAATSFSSAWEGSGSPGVPCGRKRDSEPHFSPRSGAKSRVTPFGLIP